jgi:hypothetical protein
MTTTDKRKELEKYRPPLTKEQRKINRNISAPFDPKCTAGQRRENR